MNYSEFKSELQTLGFTDATEIEEFAEVIPNAVNQAISTMNNADITPIIATYEFELDETGIVYIDMTATDGVSGFLEFADTPVLIQRNGTDLYQKFNDFDIERDNTLVIDADRNKGTFKVFYVQAHTPFTYIPNVSETEIYFLTEDSSLETGKTYYTVVATAVTSPSDNVIHLYYELDSGTYIHTEDTEVVSGKTYYTVVATAVDSPDVSDIGTYYEQDEYEYVSTDWRRQEAREIPIPRKAHHILALLTAYYVWLDDEQVKAIYYYNQYETLLNQLLSSKMEKPRGRIIAGGI